MNITNIEAMASEYFPEFSAQETPAKSSSIQEFAPNPVPIKNAFSEEDFLKAIPDALKTDDIRVFPSITDLDKYYQAAIQDEWQQFSFLENAGSILSSNPTGSVNNNETLNNYPAPGVSIAPVIVPLADFSFEHFDVNAVRRDFPILSEKVNGKNLIWLDNAATTQKPKSVIDRLVYFYEHENSNVRRGAHTLAARSTDAYEGARDTVSKFLNAPSSSEIVFVRGTTEAINLVAQSFGKYNLQKDDEIIITWLEHHANIVPWQMLCSETGAKLCVVPVDETGQVLLNEYEKLLSSRTKIVAVTHVSNALGTIAPVAEMAQMAHRYGAKVLVDGAQAVSHLKVDVQALNSDFYVFSGHKVFGPPGIGVLYAKPEILHTMRPYHGGGNMIFDVTFEKTVYQDPPHRFEAGTGNIAGAVGLGAAIDYVNSLGMENIRRYEHNLLEYSMDALKRIPGLRLIGTAKEKTSVLSFVLEGFTTEEVGSALSQEGIAVRAGHHCAQPILRRFGQESTVRPSLAFYNTCEEIDLLVSALWNLKSGRNFG
ncbi:cysteine desulfurase [Pelotomaculum isophthalicicum JI]|uniref:cysteine desulfurase n=1 Tax=Pelotomaculum isophthalicicum JI TaxID=947010 RepID=A0A9X4JVN0_9FIRM|nr:family 2A encapsulin nanocompartment cargo protein cysteine desulfurase [Pelotomaculum isophthalicicum]MDF9407677.1 cysteine desulfurase [Pelotomaculum isophthalicicum JI]